ncbi:MAG: hypothetical protein H0T71_12770 [Acidobacteria bacterium]|nr:hypothetical protein [Acidobacteriota bacterium]
MGLWLRTLAKAVLLGTVLVFGVDVLLHIALETVRGDAFAAPRWVNAHVAQRSVGVVAALLLWSIAPSLASALPQPTDQVRLLSPAAASHFVGVAMMVLPVVWFGATWIVFAARVTVQKEWTLEGRRFLEPYFYSDVVLAHAPWLLAGAAMIGLASHLRRD